MRSWLVVLVAALLVVGLLRSVTPEYDVRPFKFDSFYYFDMAAWVTANNLTSSAAIVDYFNQNFYQGTLTPEHVAVLVEYGDTATNGTPSTLNPANSAHAARVRELVGLILSLPHWQYQ